MVLPFSSFCQNLIGMAQRLLSLPSVAEEVVGTRGLQTSKHTPKGREGPERPSWWRSTGDGRMVACSCVCAPRGDSGGVGGPSAQGCRPPPVGTGTRVPSESMCVLAALETK